MARPRMVRPELRTSRVVASWPEPVRYSWVLLWGYLDRDGYGRDDPRLIAADLYPLDPRITEAVIERRLRIMATDVDAEHPAPLCRFRDERGDRWLHAIHFAEHQSPRWEKASVAPRCPVHCEEAVE